MEGQRIDLLAQRLGARRLSRRSLLPLLGLTLVRPSRDAAAGMRPLARSRQHEPTATPVVSGEQHEEYVITDGAIFVYDIDAQHRLVETIPLPPTAGSNVKGVGVSIPLGRLYVSYGGNGGPNGPGSLLALDLRTKTILWKKHYDHGIDSFDVTPDGHRLYMPDGEGATTKRTWHIVDAASGTEIGTVDGGLAPHNTVVGLAGMHAYLAGSSEANLYIRNTADGSLYRKIGPFVGGVRPFTINGRESLAYTTHTDLLGFQVSNIPQGRVLYTAEVTGFGPARGVTTSHGISLAPDETEIYLVNPLHAYVHVFDVSQVPAAAPVQVADIKLRQGFAGNEAGCGGIGSCGKDGWAQHSRDGRFVYIGDTGDVIETRTRQVVATLPAMRNTRKMLEIDWRDGQPVDATPREGIGYITR